jgi:hypothetical protein
VGVLPATSFAVAAVDRIVIRLSREVRGSVLSNNSHRGSADAARAEAAASNLPNVRERHLRSAQAHDAAAAREEKSAASLKRRQAETAARRAEQPSAEDIDDALEGGLRTPA